MTGGANAGDVIPLERPSTVIGRADEVDIQVSDRAVSTVHAIIRLDPDGTASIQDLRSTNGTSVNNQRITATTILEEGDSISIGLGTSFKFTRDKQRISAPARP